MKSIFLLMAAVGLWLLNAQAEVHSGPLSKTLQVSDALAENSEALLQGCEDKSAICQALGADREGYLEVTGVQAALLWEKSTASAQPANKVKLIEMPIVGETVKVAGDTICSQVEGPEVLTEDSAEGSEEIFIKKTNADGDTRYYSYRCHVKLNAANRKWLEDSPNTSEAL